jgi:hypothetical protein
MDGPKAGDGLRRVDPTFHPSNSISDMTQLAKVLGLLALAGTIVPPLLYLAQAMGEAPMKLIMLVSTVVWFATAPFWIKGGD